MHSDGLADQPAPADLDLQQPPSAAAAWGPVLLLLVFSVLATIDRNIIALMVEPIKATMGVSDFEVSLLQGFAFGLFYAVFGVGMGWALDRFSRRKCVYWGVTVWSVCAAACGVASNFPQLFAVRTGVGIGEAVLVPAAFVIIGSIFPPRRLAFAISVFGTGSVIGGAIALTVGAFVLGALTNHGPVTVPWLGVLEPWQLTFVVFGLPGLLVAPLIFMVPRRVDSHLAGRTRGPASRRDPSGVPGCAEEKLGAFMFRRRRYLTCHFLGFGFICMLAYAQAAWVPAYLIRRFDLSIEVIGGAIGLAHIIGGVGGFLCTGFFVDRWFASGVTDAHMRYPLYCTIALTAVGGTAFVVPNPWLCIVLVGVAYYLFAIVGIAAAHLQIVTPDHLRARLSAIFLLVFNVIGLCLGPTVVAAMTDFGFRDPAKVGLSLSITFLIGGPITVLLLWLGLPAARRAVAEAAAPARSGSCQSNLDAGPEAA